METIKIVMPPILVGFIIFESYFSTKENCGLYERKDTFTNLSIAGISIFLNILIKGSVYYVYSSIQIHSLFNIEEGIFSWIILFLLTDLQFYLFHLLGHKSRFFWAMHVIHHSSEKYNFTTAIRTPLTNSGFRFASLAPLIFLGFSPVMVITMDSIILLYAFFQHTEFIKKLGWFEYIFNTPSHHRVHHASDEKYLDKNFGGVLIVWDKLFGTFQEEEEHPVYGLTKPLEKNTVFHVIFHEWIAIVNDIRRYPIGIETLKLIFARPGWREAALGLRGNQSRRSLATLLCFIIAALVLISTASYGQTERHLVLLGIEAEQRPDIRVALKYYTMAIHHNPNAIEALTHCSRLLCTLAGREDNKEKKFQKADSARAYAMRAIEIDPHYSEARLNFIVALGLLAQATNHPAEKFRNAMRIRKEAEVLLEYDSLNASAYYILGKWHYELSTLTWIEKIACKTLFGGIPKDVSLVQSLIYYNIAISLKPKYILFHFARASALYQDSQYEAAISVLEHALRLPYAEPDDKIRKGQCLQLLGEAKKNIRSKHATL